MSQEVRRSDILHILHVNVSTVSEEKFNNLKTTRRLINLNILFCRLTLSLSHLLFEVGHSGGCVERGGVQVVGGVHPGAALHQQLGHGQGRKEVSHGAAVLEEVMSLE